MKSGVYVIRNSFDSKIYIGSSVYIRNRWSSHKGELIKKTHHNTHLQRFVNKNGFECLIFEVLEFCPIEDLLIREQFYMDKLNPSFNLRKVAESNYGLKKSEDCKRKIGLAHKGRKQTEEHRRKGSISKTGIKQSKETIEKRVSKLRNIPRTQEVKDKISLSKFKSVCQYTLEGDLIECFDSIQHAREKYPIGGMHIASCCSGKRKSACGFTWKYNI